MARAEEELQKQFTIRGIAASGSSDEFAQVRGTMCTKDEFGGWGSDLSKKPYVLADKSSNIGSLSEAASFVEASVVKEQGLCIHGNVPERCEYKQPRQARCMVRAVAGNSNQFF
jgi:hypothetical protein